MSASLIRQRVRRAAPPTAKAAEVAGADALVRRANDVDAARKALDDATGLARGLWFSFITFGAYLAIAVGSVTHRDLFLENPVKLPLLNVNLPLVAFFWIAPILLLVFHSYLMLNLKLLGDNVRAWESLTATTLDELADAGERAVVADKLRMHLPNFVVVQMLAAPQANSQGFIGWTLVFAVASTIVVGPLILVCEMLVQFLPYHSAPVTWVHRLVLMGDIVLIWYFWHGLAGDMTWTLRRRVWPAWAVLSVVLVIVATLFATFPGERHHRGPVVQVTDKILASIACGFETQFAMSRTDLPCSEPFTLSRMLFEGTVDDVTARRASLFSNTLVLPDQDFVPEAENDLAELEVTRAFRGRRLEGAVLSRADLRKADFTGALLEAADLEDSRLEGAQFECANNAGSPQCANLQHAELDGAQLQGASLRGAQLQSSSLDGAQLQGAGLEGARLQEARIGCRFDAQNQNKECANLQKASLSGAQLQGAWLNSAQLQGAQLDGANLQRASLDHAQLQKSRIECIYIPFEDEQCANLQGASLKRANLQGASLVKAQLQGAVLDETMLQDAILTEANLQSARLYRAQLQSASLNLADFQGASLDEASLQGALLDFAGLEGASLSYAYLQGASLKSAHFEGARLDHARLFGASLEGANLQGASLDLTSLLGASFKDADLRGALLNQTDVWRIRDLALDALRDAETNHIGLNAMYWANDGLPWPVDTEAYAGLLATALQGVTEETTRSMITQRFQALDPDQPPPNSSVDESAAKLFWEEVRKRYNGAAHAAFLYDLACADDRSFPYVAEGLIGAGNGSRTIGSVEGQQISIAARILDALDAGTCPGAVGISEQAIAQLHQWAPDWNSKAERHKGTAAPAKHASP